jgi:hypothetical protein
MLAPSGESLNSLTLSRAPKAAAASKEVVFCACKDAHAHSDASASSFVPDTEASRFEAHPRPSRARSSVGKPSTWFGRRS